MVQGHLALVVHLTVRFVVMPLVVVLAPKDTLWTPLVFATSKIVLLIQYSVRSVQGYAWSVRKVSTYLVGIVFKERAFSALRRMVLTSLNVWHRTMNALHMAKFKQIPSQEHSWMYAYPSISINTNSTSTVLIHLRTALLVDVGSRFRRSTHMIVCMPITKFNTSSVWSCTHPRRIL